MWQWLVTSILLMTMGTAEVGAHDFRIDQLVLDHPYATTTSGVADEPLQITVHLRTLRNDGPQSDRLLAVQTPACERVLLQHVQMNGPTRRVREVSAIELPARSSTPMRHNSSEGYQLKLEGLKAPLRNGDRFSLTLRFERAGETTISVAVLTPSR